MGKRAQDYTGSQWMWIYAAPTQRTLRFYIRCAHMYFHFIEHKKTHIGVRISLPKQQYSFVPYTRVHYLTTFSVVAVYQHHRILYNIILHINAFLVEHICFVNSPSQSPSTLCREFCLWIFIALHMIDL